MMWPDWVNGTYESLGGVFILFSVVKLYRSKVASGVSWVHVAFFTSWGFWNLFYYANLGQWFSLCGGLALALVNTIWLLQIIYYSRKSLP